MIPDMNLEDKIKLVFFIPLGFIFGVLLSAVVTFASLTSWFVLVFFFLVVIGFLVFEKISDAASLRTMEALSDRSDEELREIKERKRIGSDSKLPRYAFLLTCAAGYAATLIWPSEDILEWLSYL